MFFLDAFVKLRKATISFVIVSVRLSFSNDSAPTGRILVNLDILDFFEDL
jgi:hypothetical protein